MPTPARRLDVSLSAGTGRSRIPDGISTADRYDGSVILTGNSHPREAHSSLWVGVRPRPRRLREVFGQVLDQGLHAHRTPAPPDGVTMYSAMGLSFQPHIAACGAPDCNSCQTMHSGCRASPRPARNAGMSSSALFMRSGAFINWVNFPWRACWKYQRVPLGAYAYCNAR